MFNKSKLRGIIINNNNSNKHDTNNNNNNNISNNITDAPRPCSQQNISVISNIGISSV